MGIRPRRTAVWAMVLWIVAAAPVTALALLVYVAVQQSYRQGADDPQIQMAEDAAAALASGRAPGSVVPAARVEISQSLAAFVLVLDERGNPLASSGLLYGQPPHIPAGVLANARANGQNRRSWQPAAGVRSAIVVRPYGGARPGFVVAGRSLREVEAREGRLGDLVRWSWAVALLVSAAVCLLAGAILGVPEFFAGE